MIGLRGKPEDERHIKRREALRNFCKRQYLIGRMIRLTARAVTATKTAWEGVFPLQWR